MIIVGLSNSKKLARKIAQRLNADYEDLDVKDSADGEIHIKFKHELKDKKVVLVQSLYPHPNYALFEVLFSASVARDLGANKIIYAAPYLGYLREDSRKEKGECVSTKAIGDLLSRSVDAVVTVEPHVHQYGNINKLFSVPLYKLECNELLRSYVNKNFKNYKVLSAGDKGSKLAKHVNSDAVCFEKIKKNENVKINALGNFNDENIVIVDDMIASGRTMQSFINSLSANKIALLTVHGLFLGDCYTKLNKSADKIISSNTILHESNELDVSSLIAGKLMEI